MCDKNIVYTLLIFSSFHSSNYARDKLHKGAPSSGEHSNILPLCCKARVPPSTTGCGLKVVKLVDCMCLHVNQLLAYLLQRAKK